MAGSNKPRPIPRNTTSLTARQKIRDFVQSLPETESRKFPFEAGQVLLREGDVQEEEVTAWLVVQGEIEERITYYVPGKGQVMQTVKHVLEGQFANFQAMVPGFCDQPSFCSIHAKEPGFAIKIFPKEIRGLQKLGWLLTEAFRHQAQLLDSMAQMNAINGGISLYLEKLRQTRPDMPGDPTAIIEGLLLALRQIEELKEEQGRLKASLASSQTESSRYSAERNSLHGQLEATRAKESKADKDLEKATEKIEELARYSKTLERLIEERDAKIAQLSNPDGLQTQIKELKSVIKVHEDHLRKVARAFELLADDNPGLLLSNDVMMLMMGEEPHPDDFVPRETSVSSTEVIELASDEFDQVFDEFSDSLPPPPNVPKPTTRGG